MKARGSATWDASGSIPRSSANSSHGTTKVISSKSMEPRVLRPCTICCSQVVPHLGKVAMRTSVGLGRNASAEARLPMLPMPPRKETISATERARLRTGGTGSCFITC